MLPNTPPAASIRLIIRHSKIKFAMSVTASFAQGLRQCRSDHPSMFAKSTIQRAVDRLIFFSRWLRDPGGIASIVPSSRALANSITREIDAQTGLVLELGSGTGAFVPALLGRGVPEYRLTLVERDPSLARLLAQRFPRAEVLCVDAASFGKATERWRYGAVICGLGLLNMTPTQIEKILKSALQRMAPAASFYLFTYGRRCSVPHSVLSRLDLTAHYIGTTWRNMPPAAVFRIARRCPKPVSPSSMA